MPMHHHTRLEINIRIRLMIDIDSSFRKGFGHMKRKWKFENTVISDIIRGVKYTFSAVSLHEL